MARRKRSKSSKSRGCNCKIVKISAGRRRLCRNKKGQFVSAARCKSR